MANDLMVERKNELALDPFGKYADAVAPRYIIGELLKFSKGDYYAGINNQMVALGTVLTVNMDELMAGWIKWWDGKPVEHVMVRVADYFPPMRRLEFGDNDKKQWETDVNGVPRDPWQFSNYLPMLDEKGQLYTFAASSHGGISAIAGLSRRYAQHRSRHSDVFPLISLGVDSYQHSNREYGRIKFPLFAPAGYEPKKKFLDALAAAGIVTDAPADHEAIEAAQARTAADDMDDEVPF
jgi:hypothetical protein